MTQGAGLEYSLQAALTLSKLRAREEINSHFAAGPQARWRGASDELYPGRYVRSEQQSQQGRSPEGRGGGRASALLPLLDDVRHRLRRGASHLPARRSRQNVNLFLREPLVLFFRNLAPARCFARDCACVPRFLQRRDQQFVRFFRAGGKRHGAPRGVCRAPCIAQLQADSRERDGRLGRIAGPLESCFQISAGLLALVGEEAVLAQVEIRFGLFRLNCQFLLEFGCCLVRLSLRPENAPN